MWVDLETRPHKVCTVDGKAYTLAHELHILRRNKAANQLASVTLLSSAVSCGRLTVNETTSVDRNTAIGNTPSGDSNSLTWNCRISRSDAQKRAKTVLPLTNENWACWSVTEVNRRRKRSRKNVRCFCCSSTAILHQLHNSHYTAYVLSFPWSSIHEVSFSTVKLTLSHHVQMLMASCLTWLHNTAVVNQAQPTFQICRLDHCLLCWQHQVEQDAGQLLYAVWLVFLFTMLSSWHPILKSSQVSS